MYHFSGEAGYLQLLQTIISEGVDTPDRTGIGCRKIFDANLSFNLSTGFPASTARVAPLRMAFEEFWAFLNGIVMIDPYLKERGITFWEGNTSRNFLDRRGLNCLPEGHMGKAYGFQFRNFGGEYDSDFNPVAGIDQIAKVYNNLKADPFSRRHVVSIFNPLQEEEMALPPCWWAHEFVVLPSTKGGENRLNLKVISRSADVLFGTPFNVQQYALYLCAMATALDMEAGELSCSLIDAHLYHNQLEYAEETVRRTIYTPPSLEFKKPLACLEDILSLTSDDFELKGLSVNSDPYQAKRPPMAV